MADDHDLDTRARAACNDTRASLKQTRAILDATAKVVALSQRLIRESVRTRLTFHEIPAPGSTAWWGIYGGDSDSEPHPV